MKIRKVALIGVYPPPVGGISVHIERLCDLLEHRDIPYTVYDNTQGVKERPVVYTGPIEKWSLRYLFTCKEDVIHVHFLRWQVRVILALLALRGKRVIFTVHSMRDEERQPSLFQRLLIGLTGLLSHAFVVVNPAFRDKLVSYGIPEKKIHVIPPFLPPRIKNTEWSDEIRAFLAADGKEGEPDDDIQIVMANGAIGTFYQGQDLYGADLFVDLCKRVVETHDNVRFLYCVTHVVDRDYYRQLQEKVQERGLTRYFLFAETPAEYHLLLSRAALFIRPTNSDGNAISVYEAIQMGVPTLASDAVERLPQAILFANRNLDDLYEKTMAVLEGRLRTEEANQSLPDYGEELLALYGVTRSSFSSEGRARD
jgi:glycosyltransferase involved in cell wall biosynthesis